MLNIPSLSNLEIKIFMSIIEKGVSLKFQVCKIASFLHLENLRKLLLHLATLQKLRFLEKLQQKGLH